MAIEERKSRKLLGDILCAALERLGKTQKAMAAELGCYPACLSVWMLGKTFPPEDKMGAIIKAFRLTKEEEARVRQLRSAATRGPYARRGIPRMIKSTTVPPTTRIFVEWTSLCPEDRLKALRMMQAYKASDGEAK